MSSAQNSLAVCVTEANIASTLIYSPKQNRILGLLPVNDYARLQDDLELVHLEQGSVL